jgi:hypothetical protein
VLAGPPCPAGGPNDHQRIHEEKSDAEDDQCDSESLLANVGLYGYGHAYVVSTIQPDRSAIEEAEDHLALARRKVEYLKEAKRIASMSKVELSAERRRQETIDGQVLETRQDATVLLRLAA